MRQSQLFSKTTKDVAADEVSKNAQLLMKAGYIHKEMAGVYSYLPLGMRVLDNIMRIIREEMNAIGGQEILMNSLQRKELWEQTDRWSDEASDVWFRTSLKNGSELGLGWTHEEQMTSIMTQHIRSYKDVPALAYQFQTKFRNETRAKSGIIRTREFIMKDLYSFAQSQEEHDAIYESAKQAYVRVFERCGIGAQTFLTFASGGAFSQYSHEFQTITDAGEDVIYIDDEKGIAVNEEVHTDEVINSLGLDKARLRKATAAEVGNIFSLGTRFSEPLGLMIQTSSGSREPVIMGSYGIGPGRLMGVIVEVLSDDKGIVWPASVAPFKVHLLALGDDERVRATTDALYTHLTEQGIEVLYDDRAETPGAKLHDADLLGMPLRIALGNKSFEKGVFEVVQRGSGDVQTHDISDFDGLVQKYVS